MESESTEILEHINNLHSKLTREERSVDIGVAYRMGLKYYKMHPDNYQDGI